MSGNATVPGTLILLQMALLLAGCGGRSSDSPDTAKDAKVARSEVKRGPLRVCVEVEPAKARLSDEPLLTLTIDCEQGVEVRKPPFGESLGDFIIRDFREPLAQVKDGREIVKQIYTLEPTRTGQQFIQPIIVTFTDKRPGGDGREHTIQTEGVTIEIASVIGSEVPSLTDLRPAAGPVELPRPPNRLPWLLGGLGIVAAGLAAWWYRRRRRATVEAKRLSPRELAHIELQRILERRLAELDVKLYYVELTAVVRRYIERTTGIRAPEQTTEEFLREVGGRRTFAPDESMRLARFLESADLVKFAAHRPRVEDIEDSFDRAKEFIGLEQAAEVTE